MTAAESRLAVERAIIELSNLDDAAALALNAIRAKARAALGQLTAVRDFYERRAAEVRTEIEAQAKSDAANDDRDAWNDPPEAWFDSWLVDFACEHGVEPLTVDEARAFYVAAFQSARGAS